MAERERELLEKAVVAAAAQDGGKRLPCAEALGLAAEYQVEPNEIRCICDSKDVRISTCQLGCF